MNKKGQIFLHVECQKCARDVLCKMPIFPFASTIALFIPLPFKLRMLFSRMLYQRDSNKIIRYSVTVIFFIFLYEPQK